MNLVIIFSIIICLVIFFILLRGMYSMGGGKVAGNASQKFMRWRVAMQALAIVVVLLLIYWQS